MKLSEAIRLGAMLRPKQAFGTLYDTWERSTCALGAAAEAIGCLDTSRDNRFTVDADTKVRQCGWEWARRIIECPICGSNFEAPESFRSRNRDVQAGIVHLNNDHRWTREQIAAWVESLERANEPPTEPDAALLVLGDARPHQTEEK